MTYQNYIPWAMVAVLILLLTLKKEKVVTIEIPAKKGTHTVERPDPIVLTDTVEIQGKTKIVEVPNPVNKTLLKRYRETKDSLDRERLYKEAVTVRTYKETLQDSVQTITVTSKVIGTLESQTIAYETKPDTFQVPVTTQRLSLYAGLDVTTDIQTQLTPNLTLQTPKMLYKVGYNLNRKALTVGVSIKLF